MGIGKSVKGLFKGLGEVVGVGSEAPKAAPTPAPVEAEEDKSTGVSEEEAKKRAIIAKNAGPNQPTQLGKSGKESVTRRNLLGL